MDHLLLLRHGRTEANEKWLYCGWTDLPLSEDGRAQLRGLAAGAEYPDITGWHVYTSGLRRTEETLEILFGQVPHEALPAFREMNFGQFEMHSYEELKTCPDYLEWISGDNESKPAPDGESGIQMCERVLAGLHELAETSGDAVLIAHGGPTAAIMDHLFPGEGRNRYEWQPGGGCGYLITFSEGSAVNYIDIPQRKLTE